MTWGVVSIGVGVATSYASASSAAGAAGSSINAQNRQVIAQNKNIVEANIENTIRTGYRVGLLNMQQGQAKKDAIQMGFDTTAAAQQVMSANTANAAASGTVGASVQAVATDIKQKLGEAQAQQESAWNLQLTNFDVELHNLITQGKDSLSGANGQVQSLGTSSGSLLGNAVLSGVAQFAGMYAQRSMTLGLGTPTAAPASTPMRGLSSNSLWLGGGGSTIKW